MTFWIVVAMLSAGVTYWVTRPLLGGSAASSAPDSTEADITVYKDQLAEIDADLARGQITSAEAEAARLEVSRRLLRIKDAASAQASTSLSGLKGLHAAVTLSLPVFALGLYLLYGNPTLPAQPLAGRLAVAPDKATAADLIAKVEERLRQQPNDGMGWDVIAPVYVAQGRFDEAVDAFGQAIRLLGESPKRLEGLAMAHIRGANGLVNEKARLAFQRVLALDPQRLEAKLWLAFAKEQDGQLAEAAAEYKALLAAAPPAAPWRQALEERLAALDGKPTPAQGGAPSAAPAPSAGGSGAGVEGLSADQRAMVDRMVAGLAERLKANGADLDGWLKLVRSLKVLGREADAKTALDDARKQFAGDEKALEALAGLAKSLGLET